MFNVGDRVKAVKGKGWAREHLLAYGDIITSIKRGKYLGSTFLRFGGNNMGIRATCFELVEPVNFTLENE